MTTPVVQSSARGPSRLARPCRVLSVACALVVCHVLGSAGPAHAEQQMINTQRWHSSMDSKGLTRTNSGGLLGHLELAFTLWGDYERNPLMLRGDSRNILGAQPPDSPLKERLPALVGQRVASEAVFAFGLFRWVELSLALPLTLYQDRGRGISHAPVKLEPLSQLNLGDIRVGGKIRLLRQEEQFVDLALVPVLTLPVGLGLRLGTFDICKERPPSFHPDFGLNRWGQGYTSEGFPTFQPEVALSRWLYGFFLGGNVGLRLRRPYEVAGLTISQEVLGRVGIGFSGQKLAEHVAWARFIPVDAAVEAQGSGGINLPYVTLPYLTPNAPENRLDVRVPKPLQLYGGAGEVTGTVGVDLKYVRPYVGASVGVLPGWGTPDYRILTGLRVGLDPLSWIPKDPLDTDKDGLPDPRERCPTKPGPRSNGGCPVEPKPAVPAPADRDGDGIPDDKDKCPDQPEDVDDFEDSDGCPDPDNDGDGIPDTADKCPLQPEDQDGFQDKDGCPDPDNDSDGIVDANDHCPEKPEDPDGFEDEDGCPDLDNDNDGRPDAKDKCPLQPEDVDGFQDEDGCPDPDNDSDGIMDPEDKCPLEPETINGNQDEDGCPDKGKPQVEVKEDKIVISDRVYFDTGKATIQSKSNKILNQVALVLKSRPNLRVRVEGHTDNVGSAEYNKDLSQRRSEAVREYLIKAGIAASRLEAVGFGLTRPVANNNTPAGREANRRVEFTILATPPADQQQP